MDPEKNTEMIPQIILYRQSLWEKSLGAYILSKYSLKHGPWGTGRELPLLDNFGDEVPE